MGSQGGGCGVVVCGCVCVGANAAADKNSKL